MSKAISVENVSKKYIISHRGRSTHSLRDAITDTAKRLVRSKEAWNQSHEEFWALRDVSYDIKSGERVGIIGGNGAGKSTMLKILSRITEPSHGQIRLQGRVASLLEVGTGFHPELTGRENIFLNGAILGMGKAEIKKKFDEIINFAEIEKFLDTPVKRYSSGMYVRLAFAVAAHLEPEILIVDEVLAVGDMRFQKKCLGKMEEVGREGRTILFVSHNLMAVRSLCTRAILLEKGKLVADDSVDKVAKIYLGSVNGSVLEREWSDGERSPQNPVAMLRKVRVCDDNGNSLEEIWTDKPFNFEIEFQVKKPDSIVGLTVILYDDESNVILSSINTLEENWYDKRMPEGIFRSICRVPENLLNNGWFNLTINIFSKGFSDLVSTNNLLRIEVLDGPTVRGNYTGDYGGGIRPLFNWRTDFVQEIE
jgi:lipopolysaccharide transport system ATP-binding protein